MAAPGTTEPAGQANACAPSFPSAGWNGGYVCVAHPEVGTVFQGGSGATFCTYWGFVAHKAGDYVCADYSNVLPGDLVSSDAGSTTSAQYLSAKAICAARGMTLTTTTVDSIAFVACAGTPASVVGDSQAQAKLDTLNTSVNALHTDLGTLNTSTVANKPATASGVAATVQTGDTSAVADAAVAQYTPTVLMGAVLTAALLVRAWEFGKRVVSA